MKDNNKSTEKVVTSDQVPTEMTEDRVIEFLDWINNNWFIPAEDS